MLKIQVAHREKREKGEYFLKAKNFFPRNINLICNLNVTVILYNNSSINKKLALCDLHFRNNIVSIVRIYYTLPRKTKPQQMFPHRWMCVFERISWMNESMNHLLKQWFATSYWWFKFHIYNFFQVFKHILIFFQNFTHKSKNCTLKMQNSSHLLQNEALCSKCNKHISKANICKHLCYKSNSC